MRILANTCLLLLCSLAAPAQDWKILFDGKTSAGWLEITGLPFPTATWTIEGGCLKTIPNPDGNQDIRTVETFRSFEFEFEWKIAKDGNSGVKYLIQKTDRWQRRGQKGFQARARGLEYQLLDDSVNAEAKTNPLGVTAALYNVFGPSRKLPVASGVFYRARIVVKGDHVEHWFNGEKVVAFELGQPELTRQFRQILGLKAPDAPLSITRAGPISLQNHNSVVWFRNLRVRRLDGQ